MTNDELMKALECHIAGNMCGECPCFNSGNCSKDMDRAALDALNTKNESNMKDESLDRQQMVLEAIKLALNKGYNVIITPTTCEIRLIP